MSISRRRFVVLAGVWGGASLMAACQGAAPATPKPASGEAARAAPASSGGLVQAIVLQGVDANTLDPQFRNSTPEFNINAHVFNMVNWRDPKSLKPVPEFAQELKLVDDTTWEIKTPAGAKFHDGTPADAEALVFSLTRQAKLSIGGRPTVQGSTFGRLSAFESAQALNATTVRIKTKTPSAIMPDLLVSVEVVPPSVYADESEANLATIATKPVGGGPYRLVEWVKDDRVVLEAFDGYWGQKPVVRSVTIKPVPELSTRVLALQNGQADVIVNVAPDQVPIVDRSDTGRVSKVSGGRSIFVGMRVDNPILSDKRVRQAFNYAFNFDAVNRSLLAGAGVRSKTIINPPHEPPNAAAYAYDPEKAKQLLADAGWQPGADGVLTKGGEKLALDMMSPSGRYIKDKEIAQAIQQDLQRIGVQVDIKVMDWSVYAGDILAKRNPSPLYLLGLGSPFDGQTELNYLHKDYQLNSTYWTNEEYHRLFDELRSSMDESKRQDLMNRLWAIAFDDPPWIYVYHQVDFYGVSKRLDWQARADERIRMSEAKLA